MMTTTFNNRTIVQVAFTLFASLCSPAMAGVTTYPAPGGEAVVGGLYGDGQRRASGHLRCAERVFRGGLLLCNTQNAVVRNCFFRTQDDCIAIKGLAEMTRPCENIVVEDCEFWTDVANIFRIGYECETAGMRNITARNIDVLHYSKDYRDPTHYWANAIIWLQPNQNLLMENCHFEKLRVRSSGEDIIMLMAKPMRCSYGPFKDPEPGTLRNCSFQDIAVHGEEGSFRGLIYMLGDSEQHNVSGMSFERVTYFGQPVLQESPCVEMGPFVSDVRFGQ